MRKLVLISIMAISSLMVMTSCGSETASNQEELQASTTYYCPMKCEGEKVYDKEGSCPDCGMDLVKVEE